MKIKKSFLLIIAVLLVGVLLGLALSPKSKKPGLGSSEILIEEINKLRGSKNIDPLQLDENLCRFAMERANDYKFSQDKKEAYNTLNATVNKAKNTYLSDLKNIEESVLIYERENSPIKDRDVAIAFLQQETPLVLSSKIEVACIEEEPYENYRYFIFIGASE